MIAASGGFSTLKLTQLCPPKLQQALLWNPLKISSQEHAMILHSLNQELEQMQVTPGWLS